MKQTIINNKKQKQTIKQKIMYNKLFNSLDKALENSIRTYIKEHVLNFFNIYKEDGTRINEMLFMNFVEEVFLAAYGHSNEPAWIQEGTIKENKKTIDIIAYVLKDEIQKNNLSEVLNF